MRYMSHRGSLSAAVATMVTLPDTMAALREHIASTGSPVFLDTLEVKSIWGEAEHGDPRIGWTRRYTVTGVYPDGYAGPGEVRSVVGSTDTIPEDGA